MRDMLEQADFTLTATTSASMLFECHNTRHAGDTAGLHPVSVTVLTKVSSAVGTGSSRRQDWQ